jgi:hypothetical protein
MTGRYETPSPDVNHFRLTTESETFVGVHVWNSLYDLIRFGDFTFDLTDFLDAF